MAATPLVKLIVAETFNCLAIRDEQFPLDAYYHKHLPTESAIEDLIGKAQIVFAPGLLDVLQCDDPPTVEYFKALPTLSDSKERTWGVYLIVLEKADFEDLAYIGSGTQYRGIGLAQRLADYREDDGHKLPINVEAAIKAGYSIVHKGVLAQNPTPPAELMLAVRTLLVSIEGTLAALLWTMYTPNGGDWGMGDVCR